MRRAIELAELGRGKTYPNPVVGAVIARGDDCLAEGYHQRAGGPHAEIVAIRALREPARGATLYVTMEPCSTHGRTPPCTEAILRAGFRRVVFGATDPNPAHAGRAEMILRDRGVRVKSGVLAGDCAHLNLAWNKWISTGLPWVIAKAGMSVDGRINSPPGHRWITSAAARSDAMWLRAACDAVLVGGQTIRDDNPLLTLRGTRRNRFRPPLLRAVWTRSGNLPPDSNIFTDNHAAHTRIYQKIPLRTALRRLAGEGAQSVLIEGGGRVLGEAFDRQLVDEVVFYIAAQFLGGPTLAVAGLGAAGPGDAAWLEGVTCRIVGGNLRIQGRVKATSSISPATHSGQSPYLTKS
ncbi:MAG: bifunctional diaminohydroxyphosphoribosylaminopyrimidine deaminase/5-amino-6-(5-phosphoribosylamino)uracil reductase RibD [Terrimicrobiaceae bacterium]